MPGRKKPIYSYGRLRLFFNAIILVLSVSFIFFLVLVWGIRDYNVMLSYVISTAVSFVGIYFLKLALLRIGSSSTLKPTEAHNSEVGSGRRETVLSIAALLSILATPLIVLFFAPNLWLLVMDGIVSGAVVSDLALYYSQREE